jgi:hypothetical protein
MNFLRGAEAIHLRHGKIKHHKVGLLFRRHGDGFPSRCSLTADFPSFVLQGLPDKSSDQGMIVGDQNSHQGDCAGKHFNTARSRAQGETVIVA